jgi:hypothetical protein
MYRGTATFPTVFLALGNAAKTVMFVKELIAHTGSTTLNG